MVTVRYLVDLSSIFVSVVSAKENFSCFVQRTSAKHVVFPRIFLKENDGILEESRLPCNARPFPLNFFFPATMIKRTGGY